MSYLVPFLTVEDSDDLIVSFPIGHDAARSLTLLRTPKFEAILDEEDRGVSVSLLEPEETGADMLRAVEWIGDTVRLDTTSKSYVLDLRKVAAEEIAEAKRVLLKMNFDGRFRLNVV
jgi:hypothetical protein